MVILSFNLEFIFSSIPDAYVNPCLATGLVLVVVSFFVLWPMPPPGYYGIYLYSYFKLLPLHVKYSYAAESGLTGNCPQYSYFSDRKVGSFCQNLSRAHLLADVIDFVFQELQSLGIVWRASPLLARTFLLSNWSGNRLKGLSYASKKTHYLWVRQLTGLTI